jgi:hypothetical protein
MWDLSCVDWEDRIREGRSLIPELPLFAGEADMGLQFYDELQLPDVPGSRNCGPRRGSGFAISCAWPSAPGITSTEFG